RAGRGGGRARAGGRLTRGAMRFASTRDSGGEEATFSEALARGLAPDGGLYVPCAWPRTDLDALANARSFAELAARLLAPLVDGDVLAKELAGIVREAFDFSVPLVPVSRDVIEPSVLELFHGPTAAFKDFGARFLAAALGRARRGARGVLRI